MRIVGLMLAAGQGRRFGGDKLAAPWRGRLLGEHAAAALGAVVDERIAVCQRDAPLVPLLARSGFRIVINDDPAAGQSRSLALGLAAAGDADAVLVVLGDMPRVTAAHLAALLAAFDGVGPVASASEDMTGPPAILPRTLWPALLAMTGDRGARAWLAGAQTVAAPAAMLVDIDTPSDLASG